MSFLSFVLLCFVVHRLYHDISLDASDVAQFSCRFKCGAFFLSLLLTFQIGSSLQGLLSKGAYMN